MVPLSHLYMTTGKTIALTIWTLVGKVKITILYFFIYFCFFRCLLKYHLPWGGGALLLSPPHTRKAAPLYWSPSPHSAFFSIAPVPQDVISILICLLVVFFLSSLECKLCEGKNIFCPLLYIVQQPGHAKYSMNVC